MRLLNFQNGNNTRVITAASFENEDSGKINILVAPAVSMSERRTCLRQTKPFVICQSPLPRRGRRKNINGVCTAEWGLISGEFRAAAACDNRTPPIRRQRQQLGRPFPAPRAAPECY